LYCKIMESMQAPIITGKESLIGQVVQTDGSGAVHWHGEWWTAEPCLPDQRVRVNALRGLHLVVTAAGARTNE
ncbi:MAG: NfeD family protein, partial [bacterium]